MGTTGSPPATPCAPVRAELPAKRGAAVFAEDAPVDIDVHLDAEGLYERLRADALRGLTASPKDLPPKWFYDERGCLLFDAITRLHEYYPTHRERSILVERAAGIAALTRADTLVEIGSGTSEKTRILLDALSARGGLRRFVPFDVSEPTLRAAALAVQREYPGTAVSAVVGDFEEHLRFLPRGGTRLVAFLGGTIGNLAPAQRATFLAEIASGLAPGDSFLLGTDLVKDAARLESAYDDPLGVTAEFNRNVLHVLNRELGADFVPERFEHVALFDEENEWIEMRLRSVGDQPVSVPALDIAIDFTDGEEMRTEISAKFRREVVEAEVAAAGLHLSHWWTDPANDFALSLSVPT